LIQQPLQIVQQTRIVFADCFDQIRKRKRGGRARAKQLQDSLANCRFLQFFLCVSRKVAECSALGCAVQQLLLEKTIERGITVV
jgi:hypothetical protein